MPGSAFSLMTKMAARMVKLGSVTARGAVASLDDIVKQAQVGTAIVVDDIPVKSQAITGVEQDQEKALFKQFVKGAVQNRLWIIPTVVGITTLFPAVLTPILMVGGSYLSYELGEKLTHTAHSASHFLKEHGGLRGSIAHLREEHGTLRKACVNKLLGDIYKVTNEPSDEKDTSEPVDPQQLLRSAKMMDAIMTLELVGIMAGSLVGAPWYYALFTLAASTAAVSAGVFGTTYGLIRADNVGLALMQAPEDEKTLFGLVKKQTLGKFITQAAPVMMYTLGVVGTLAMGIIGGELLIRGIEPLHHLVEAMPGMLGVAAAFGTATVAGVALTAAHKAAHPYLEKIGHTLGPIVKPALGFVQKLGHGLKQKSLDLVQALRPKKADSSTAVAVAPDAAPAAPAPAPALLAVPEAERPGLTIKETGPSFTGAVGTPSPSVPALEAPTPAPPETPTPTPTPT